MKTPIAYIDFETYYDNECSVKTLGSTAYCNHPDFDAYLVSIVYRTSPKGGKPGKLIKWVGHPKDADWEAIGNKIWVSHNMQFDWTVFLWCAKKYKIKVRPLAYHCTAALAAYLGAPRNLAGAAFHLLDIKLDKGIRDWMKGRTFQDAINEGKADALMEYALNDSVVGLQIYEKYIDQWPEEEIWLHEHTVMAAMNGMQVDVDYLNKAIKKLEKERFNIESGLPWMKDNPDAKPTSIKGLAETCRSLGIPPPKSTAEDSPERELWEAEYGDKYPWVKGMTSWRKCNGMLKKLRTLQMRIDSKGIFSFSIKYFGAHTGRWSGDAGYNMHGQARDDVFGISQRNCLMARKGYKLIVSDYAQIEPRILHWIVGDEEWLKLAATGVNIYQVHAAMYMGWDIKKDLKKLDNTKYRLAKAREIGLGYCCGGPKFVAVAKTMAGLDITQREAKIQVQDYRVKNKKIVRQWAQLDAQFQRSVGDSFEMELPSGRTMTYFNVIRKQGQTFAQDTMGAPHKPFYGGKLTENLVQASARDLLAAHLRILEEDRHVRVPFHTHDEMICEVPKNFPIEEITSVMETAPSWFDGLPIGVEATESDRYGK